MKYIIFHDGTYKKIKDEQANEIWNRSTHPQTRGFKLRDGTYIAFSSIAKIVNKEEFYQQYPDKKPESDYKRLKLPAEWNVNRYMKRKDCLAKIIKGFEKFIAKKGGLKNCNQATRDQYNYIIKRKEQL